MTESRDTDEFCRRLTDLDLRIGSDRIRSCGLPDTFGLTLKTTKCVFASSDLLARMHGGLLNFYALVVLFLFLVLMPALCGWW
jgi:hypothetical protein